MLGDNSGFAEKCQQSRLDFKAWGLERAEGCGVMIPNCSESRRNCHSEPSTHRWSDVIATTYLEACAPSNLSKERWQDTIIFS